MELLIYLVLAFSPGLFWIWFFVRRDVYRPEPRRLIALTFFLGMVSTIPAAIIEAIFLDESILAENANLASVAVGMLFVVGPVEELSKFMAVRLLAYKSLYFDEPGDGLVYRRSAATMKNVVWFRSMQRLAMATAR